MNTNITIRGLYISDQAPGHDGHSEIHPVYKVIYGPNCPSAAPCFSGPAFAGSPEKMRPDTGQIIGVNGNDPEGLGRRYCWDPNGNPCRPWRGEDTPFY